MCSALSSKKQGITYQRRTITMVATLSIGTSTMVMMVCTQLLKIWHFGTRPFMAQAFYRKNETIMFTPYNTQSGDMAL
jgi:hypothetical protein